MAGETTTKELIYSIKLDIAATNQSLAAYEQRVMAVSKAQGELTAASGAQEEAVKRQETVVKKHSEALAAEEGSIKAIREQNKLLTAERNATSVSTEAGRKKVEELNKQLDANNKVIKDNVDAYTKQKIGIGDYSGTLDKLIPGLGSTATGFLNMAKASYAFIATGIGAIVVGLGLAFGALMKYFQGSEEGQNKLNKIMAIGGAIMEKIMDVVEGLGEALFGLFDHPIESLKAFGDFLITNIINRFKALAVIVEGITDLDFKKVANGVLQLGTGIEDVIGKTQNLAKEVAATFNLAVEQGNKLAELQARIDKDERAAVTDRQRVALEVAKLRAQAVAQEGEERKATIQAAIALEEDLSAREVARAQRKLEQAKLLLATNGDDKEALMAVAQAEGEVLAAQTQRFEATLRFQKELERIQDEEKAKKAQEAEDTAAFNQASDDRAWAATQASLERDQKAREAAKAKQLKTDQDHAEKRKQIEKQGEDFALASITKVTGLKINSSALYNNFFKAGAIAQTKINAETMSTGAYNALVGIPIVGPIIAPIAALVARAFAYASAAGIQAITFARGGSLKAGGMFQGRRHSEGGEPFTINGRGGYEAEDGEIIINRRSSAMFRPVLSRINQAGGGIPFASGGITDANRQIGTASETRLAYGALQANDIARAMLEEMRNPQPPILVLQDFEAKQFDRDETASRARVV